jgi:hypothetical protein
MSDVETYVHDVLMMVMMTTMTTMKVMMVMIMNDGVADLASGVGVQHTLCVSLEHLH